MASIWVIEKIQLCPSGAHALAMEERHMQANNYNIVDL